MIVNFESELAKRKNFRELASHDSPSSNQTSQENRDGFKQLLAAINNGQKRFQVFPRLLTKVQAASYCGMGIESFALNCSVKAIRVRSGARGLRWDIQDLDKWIDRLKENSSTDSEENVDWLAKIDGQNQDKRREGLRQQG
jgi:hypothetical protein